MKKILLASNGKAAIELLLKTTDKPPKELKVAWITTAKKGVDDLTYLSDRIKHTKGLGLKLEEIDLDNYKQETLREKLINYDVVFVDGGNTFYLLKAVKKSGFDKIIVELLERDIIYVGSSAGAYIMCPTIEISTWIKPIWPKFGVNDYSAIGLVPFIFKAHYTKDLKSLLKQKAAKSDFPIRLLKDGQAFLVENDKISLIGDGKEEKL